MTVRTADEHSVGAPLGRPFALNAQDELTLEFPWKAREPSWRSGRFSYRQGFEFGGN
ncbi:hypothetical protein [Mesorhizobium abyssinicae]